MTPIILLVIAFIVLLVSTPLTNYLSDAYYKHNKISRKTYTILKSIIELCVFLFGIVGPIIGLLLPIR